MSTNAVDWGRMAEVFPLAAARARERPLALPPDVAEERPPQTGYQDFVSLAGWLQVVVGDAPILLPVRELSALLGPAPITISRYRAWGVEDGFLTEVAKAEFRSSGKGSKATEFRFAVGRFPELARK